MSDNTPEMDILKPTLSGDDKRIVFQHTEGPYPGLMQIMGLTSELGVKPGEPLPDTAEGFEACGRLIVFASLVTVKTRYALYRELMPFGKPQKDFDRRQV